MALRPLKPEERALIQHLLGTVRDGNRYAIPDQVENLGDGGAGGIQLSKNGQHARDLVEATYLDDDRREVLITLTVNQHDELYDLDIWKADFSPLLRYPTPDRVLPEG
ncbi:MAG TPA: hypothetical protein VHK69_12100 [Chitinophagaceae bacterium]|nr:hypothetical protein [Chitinophagaceae bacterium]